VNVKNVIERVKTGDLSGVQMELSRYGIDPKEIFYETFKQTPIFFCALIKNRERCVEMTNFFI